MNISIPKSFLEEIQQWMMANDYECGEQGSEIYDKITTLVSTHELNQEIFCCSL